MSVNNIPVRIVVTKRLMGLWTQKVFTKKPELLIVDINGTALTNLQMN